MITTLVKVFVAKFYERNAGFFFFTFFLMFGIVESSQLVNYHLALIAGMVAAPSFLLLVMIIWLAYLLKCMMFITGVLDRPENEFLFRLGLLPIKTLRTTIVLMVCLNYLPVLIYSFIVIAFAIGHSFFLPAIAVALFHIVVIYGAALFISRKISTQHKYSRTIKFFEIRWPGARPLPIFYIGHLTNQYAIMFLVTKIFSLLCLLGFLQIPLDGYENRLVFLGILFGLMAHIVIIFELRRFEDRYLEFLRTFPLTYLTRFLVLVVVYALILIPETLLLFFNQIHLLDIAIMLFSGIGFLISSHFSLYRQTPDMDRFVQWIFGLFLTSFMLVLWKLYILTAVVCWIIGFLFLRKNFYEFEGAES